MTLSLFSSNLKHELTHPISGEPTGLVVEVLPPDHDAIYNANLDVVHELRTKGSKEALELGAQIDHRIKVAATTIVGWEAKSEQWVEAFKEMGYQDATYTAEKALKLLSLPTAGWIRIQIDKLYADTEAFFKKASNS